MTNTEKPTTKAESKKQGVVNTPKEKIQSPMNIPIKTDKQNIKEETKKDEQAKEPKKEDTLSPNNLKVTEGDKKDTSKKITKPKIKRTEAVINSLSLPISTKYSIAICKFIKYKRIGDAIRELEQVLKKKKAIPMNTLEVPHKKGKGMSSGRYPKKATEYFIKLLKTLSANASVNEIEEPIITEAIANLASRPYGRFGRVRKKRTHVKIVVKEKNMLKKLNKGKSKHGREKRS